MKTHIAIDNENGFVCHGVTCVFLCQIQFATAQTLATNLHNVDWVGALIIVNY